MVAAALGLLIAGAFGTGDFVGGRASRHSPTLAVLFVAQCCAVVGALAVSLALHSHVTVHDVAFGALAGAVNVLGLGLLYQALAQHAAGIVAPIAAVLGAVVPVTWALVDGERPSALVLSGCIIAIAAAALVAREPGPLRSPGLARGSLEALAAGALLGSSLIFYDQTASASGQWPVFTARTTSLVLVSVAVLWSMRRGTRFTFPTGSARTMSVAAGFLDVAATSLIVVAVRRELMVVVAPFAALAPAVTVLLAWLVLGERLHRAQRFGFLIAVAALVLVAVG